MEFLTNEKLTIVGAAGMIGSNMAQNSHDDETHSEYLPV